MRNMMHDTFDDITRLKYENNADRKCHKRKTDNLFSYFREYGTTKFKNYKKERKSRELQYVRETIFENKGFRVLRSKYVIFLINFDILKLKLKIYE